MMIKKTLSFVFLALCLAVQPDICYATADTQVQQTDEQAPGNATNTDAASRIYNAAQDIYIVQGTTDIDKVTEKISALSVAVSPSYDDIRQTRFLYNALTLAQKSRVPNEQTLFDLESKYNITYDYASIYAQSVSNTDNVTNSMIKGTSYTFQITGDDSLSISLKYTQDNDMDGLLDIPAITIKKPDANIISVSKENTELRDSEMNMKLTWSDDFMQIDIASASAGKWTIQTNEPVIFTPMEYAGSKQDITEIPDVDSSETTHTETDAAPATKKTSFVGIYIKLGIVVFFVVLLIMLPKILNSLGSKKGKEMQATIAEQKKEESLEDLKAEFDKILANEDYSDYEETHPEKEKEEIKKQEPVISQDKIDETMEDISEDSGVLFWQPGDPGLPGNNVPEQVKEKNTDFDDDFFDI